MIIADQSDTSSIFTLVPEKDSDKVPRFLVPLTYGSLGFSILPFVFSLISISTSPEYSIPTVVAFVFTTPFHIASLFVAWQHARGLDPTLPFEPTSIKAICYTLWLCALWVGSTVVCICGSRLFQAWYRRCEHLDDVLIGIPVECDTPLQRTLITFAISTALSGVETMMIGLIVWVCWKNRPKKVATDSEAEMVERVNPKVLGV